MSSPHPPASPHRPPEEIVPGVWFVSSENRMKTPVFTIPFGRNMVAVRGPDGWVVLNPVRMREDAEQALLARTPVRHVVRLGTFHGRDDAYYVEKFGAEFWAVPGPQTYQAPPITREIADGAALPIPGASAVVFTGATRAECIVYLSEQRLLVTCDSVQHYEGDPWLNWKSRLLMTPMGFFKPCVIGPIWLKEVTPPGGSLKPDFERILALDFDTVISAHGAPKRGGAKAALRQRVDRLP
jgi:hypothetical protein